MTEIVGTVDYSTYFSFRDVGGYFLTGNILLFWSSISNIFSSINDNNIDVSIAIIALMLAKPRLNMFSINYSYTNYIIINLQSRPITFSNFY